MGLGRFWYGLGQAHPRQKPFAASIRDLLPIRHEFFRHSAHLWSRPGDVGDKSAPALFLPVFDFDQKEGGPSALTDALGVCADLLDPLGLREGRDYALCVSGTSKGIKIFWLRWLPPEAGWHLALRQEFDRIAPQYPTLDVGMATIPLVRAIGSRHRDGKGYQRLIYRNHLDLAVARFQPDQDCPERSLAFGFYAEPDPFMQGVLDRYVWTSLLKKGKSKMSLVGGKWRRRWSEALGAAGIRYRVHAVGKGQWLRLHRCPYCGSAYKAAISPNGYLNCFKASCGAHLGVHPGKWTDVLSVDPSKATLLRMPSASVGGYARYDAPPVEAARQEVADEVEDALSTHGRLPVLAVTPGAGKTYQTMIKLAEVALKGETAALLGPTRALAAEAGFDYSGIGALGYVVQPRNMQNCNYMTAIQIAQRRGFMPGRFICPRCPDFSGCQYWKGLEVAEQNMVRFSTWEHASLFEERIENDILIYDEDPSRVILQQVNVSSDTLQTWIDRPATSAAVSLAAAALLDVLLTVESDEGSDSKFEVWYRGQVLVELIKRVDASHMATIAAGAEEALAIRPAWQKIWTPATMFQAPSVVFLDFLIGWRRVNGHGMNRANGLGLVVDGVGRKAAAWSLTQRNAPAQPHLVLDAYADEVIYERLFNRPINLRKIDVLIRAQVLWWPRKTTKNAYSKDKADIHQIISAATEALLGLGHQRVLVLTYKGEVDDVKLGLARFGGRAEVRHAYAGAGVNSFKDFSAVVCAITPRPRHGGLASAAGALWEGENVILEAAKDDCEYVDHRLDRLLRARREQEMAQQIHRIRPVLRRGDNPARKAIVLIGQVPMASLPEPIRIKSIYDLKIAQRIDTWAAWGWWSDLLLDAAAGKPLSRRARKRYSEFSAEAKRFYGLSCEHKYTLKTHEGGISDTVWCEPGGGWRAQASMGRIAELISRCTSATEATGSIMGAL